METNTNLRIFGYENESVNGTNIKDQGFDLNYNGDHADLNVFADGTTKYQRLSKEDILNIMGVPSSPITLEERLIQLSEEPTPFHRTPTPYPHHIYRQQPVIVTGMPRDTQRDLLVPENQSQPRIRTRTRTRTITRPRIKTTRKILFKTPSKTKSKSASIAKYRSGIRSKTKTRSRTKKLTQKTSTKNKPSIENTIY